jgi:hypothetical protein
MAVDILGRTIQRGNCILWIASNCITPGVALNTGAFSTIGPNADVVKNKRFTLSRKYLIISRGEMEQFLQTSNPMFYTRLSPERKRRKIDLFRSRILSTAPNNNLNEILARLDQMQNLPLLPLPENQPMAIFTDDDGVIHSIPLVSEPKESKKKPPDSFIEID